MHFTFWTHGCSFCWWNLWTVSAILEICFCLSSLIKFAKIKLMHSYPRGRGGSSRLKNYVKLVSVTTIFHVSKSPNLFSLYLSTSDLFQLELQSDNWNVQSSLPEYLLCNSECGKLLSSSFASIVFVPYSSVGIVFHGGYTQKVTILPLFTKAIVIIYLSRVIYRSNPTVAVCWQPSDYLCSWRESCMLNVHLRCHFGVFQKHLCRSKGRLARCKGTAIRKKPTKISCLDRVYFSIYEYRLDRYILFRLQGNRYAFRRVIFLRLLICWMLTPVISKMRKIISAFDKHN